MKLLHVSSLPFTWAYRQVYAKSLYIALISSAVGDGSAVVEYEDEPKQQGGEIALLSMSWTYSTIQFHCRMWLLRAWGRGEVMGHLIFRPKILLYLLSLCRRLRQQDRPAGIRRGSRSRSGAARCSPGEPLPLTPSPQPVRPHPGPGWRPAHGRPSAGVGPLLGRRGLHVSVMAGQAASGRVPSWCGRVGACEAGVCGTMWISDGLVDSPCLCCVVLHNDQHSTMGSARGCPGSTCIRPVRLDRCSTLSFSLSLPLALSWTTL